MADIKLESDYWETSGIRDIAQNKTQRQINAEVNGEIDGLQDIVGDGPLTGFTATDLTGAANELKGSLNTITPFDTTPTNGSTKGVTSGGVYTALHPAVINTEFTLLNGLTREDGGYAKIGNFVVVNIRLRNTSGGALSLQGQSIISNLPAPISTLRPGSGVGMAYANKSELNGFLTLLTYESYGSIYAIDTNPFTLNNNEIIILSAYYIAK